MSKRYFPIAVLTGILAAVALFGYMTPTQSEATPVRILLDNAGGKVVFNHAVHTKDYGAACETCHHETAAGDQEPLSCGQCHGANVTDAWVKEHKTTFTKDLQCVTCHHVEFDKNHDWGHKSHEDIASCTDCHHADTSIEPEPANCADCHQAEADGKMPALRDAVHAKCQSCHADMFEAQLKGCASCHGAVDQKEQLKSGTLKKEFTKCTSCHSDKGVNEIIPSRMTSLHASCMGCHEKQDAGPYKKGDCNQCHFR